MTLVVPYRTVELNINILKIGSRYRRKMECAETCELWCQEFVLFFHTRSLLCRSHEMIDNATQPRAVSPTPSWAASTKNEHAQTCKKMLSGHVEKVSATVFRTTLMKLYWTTGLVKFKVQVGMFNRNFSRKKWKKIEKFREKNRKIFNKKIKNKKYPKKIEEKINFF